MLDNLNKKLNAEFVEETKKVENEIEAIETKKNEIVKRVENTAISPITFEDQKYLLDEIRDLICSTTRILEKLEQDIKIGSPPRMYEVYSALTNAKVNQLRELRELNKMILDMQIFQNVPEEKGKGTVGRDEVKMTALDLLKIVKAAQKSSSMNAIEADFKIVNEDEDEAAAAAMIKK